MTERPEDSLRAKVRRASRIGVSLPDDRYVPLRVDDLVAAMAKDEKTFGPHAARLPEVLDALERIVARESQTLLREVERTYDPFNPDRETLALSHGADEAKCVRRLQQQLAYMFDKANFDVLDEVQLEAAIRAASSHGMKIEVRPERVDSIDLFVRGRTDSQVRVKTLRHPIKGVPRDVELYRRLGVVFRMRGEKAVNIKLFREIPVSDLEALLPHAEVVMGSFDRVKIIGGGLGALGGVTWKAINVIVAGTLFATSFLWALIAAFLGLSVRSFLGYRRARLERAAQRTHHLYYQNVANNLGVIELLVGSIAYEELKEGLMAYAFLAGDQGTRLRGVDTLAATAERWLGRTFDIHVDFDIGDALEELDRLGLWADRDDWTVVPIPEALRILDAHARDRLDEDYHVRAVTAASAEPDPDPD